MTDIKAPMTQKESAIMMKHFRYIWGWSKEYQTEHSFLTWDDIYIYQNIHTKIYYYYVDTGIYGYIDEAAARDELGRLSEIENAFRNFVTEMEGEPSGPICFMDYQDEGAETLGALYYKFCMQYEGYKWYINNKPQS